MVRADVEVATLISDCHSSGIVDLDGFGAGKDKVLGDFDTETTAADNKDIHLHELAHGLETEGSDLARVQVRINLDFFNHCVVCCVFLLKIGYYYKSLIYPTLLYSDLPIKKRFN